MAKKSTLIFTILAMLAFGACTCWGYTVSQWPVPGIPNTVYGTGLAGPGQGGYDMYGGSAGYGQYGWYGYPGYYGQGFGAYGPGYHGRGRSR